MQHLMGAAMPDVSLPSSQGGFLNPHEVAGRAVYFCYPYTGRPGVADPRGWDDIAGAHGSTPQALTYGNQIAEFQNLDVSVFGVSLHSLEWISDFASRNGLPYALLSDQQRQFSDALQLPRFSIDGVDYLKRLTLVASAGIITHVVFPVIVPALDAAHVLSLLK